MPKSKNKLITKQKRLIETRLIQISLLVDDYIFHEKPMSSRSAEAYIREISAYKDKCYQDVRSLQVIEKLTRFMQEIISEQQEFNGECNAEGDTGFPFQDVSNNVTLSPVYSTVDEDLQMLDDPLIEHDKPRPCVDDRDDKETDSNKVIPEEFYNTETTTQAKDPVVSNDIEVTDICDDDIDDLLNENDINIFQNEPQLILQSAISYPSINDIEEVFKMPFSQECSQSVLDNFDPINCSLAKDVVTPLTTVPTATATQQKPDTDKVTFNDRIKIVLPQTKTNRPITIENKQIIQKGLNDKSKITKHRTPKTSNSRNKNITRKSVPSETVATNISSSVTNETCTVKVAKTKRQAKKQKNIKAKEKTTKQINNTIPKPNIMQTANQYETSISGNKTHFTHPDVPPTQIVRGNTANDLSWIENIRFVREVACEEYEAFAGDFDSCESFGDFFKD